MPKAAAIWSELGKETAHRHGNITIDLSRVKIADRGIVALLAALRGELATRNIRVELAGANATVATVVDLYAGHETLAEHTPRKPESMIPQLGSATFELFGEAKALLDFLGGMILAVVALARNPRAGHWKDLALLCEKAGADAVPIVLSINFLVGFVVAFMSAKQLKLFGANIYVADLVGISLTRELAPLMTAIIVIGRSGAAFAAELGSMTVNGEIDALRTLGLAPVGWLVLPRVIALILVVPTLTILGDCVGIAGGMLVGFSDLDLTPRGYFVETLTAVHGLDVATGLVKSIAFAAAIGLISCQQGFAATGGAEAVGRRTTSSVVTSLFTLVVIDAALTVLFRLCNL